MMNNCNNCKQENPPGEKTCTRCGATIDADAPSNIVLIERKNGLSLTYHPSKRNIYLFHGGLAGFLVFTMVAASINGPAPRPGEFLMISASFVVVLAFVLLLTLSIRLNKATIILTRHEPGSSDAPFRENSSSPVSTLEVSWWNLRKNTETIRLRDIEQIFCEKRVAQRRERNADMVRAFYDLKIKYKDGRVVSLLPPISEPNIAMFIENKLESALGITDRSIS